MHVKSVVGAMSLKFPVNNTTGSNLAKCCTCYLSEAQNCEINCFRISLQVDSQTVSKSPLRSSCDVKHISSILSIICFMFNNLCFLLCVEFFKTLCFASVEIMGRNPKLSLCFSSNYRARESTRHLQTICIVFGNFRL